MLKCPACSQRGLTISLLHNHIRNRHQNIKTFVCQQEGCCRSFSCQRTLYRHIRNFHSNLLHSKQVEGSLHDCPGDPFNDEISLNEMRDRTGPTSRAVSEECCSSSFSELCFVLKLYKQPNFSRNDVDQVIKNTIDLFNSGTKVDNLRKLDSEYKRKKELIKQGLFLDSETIVLGYQKSFKFNRNLASHQLVQTPITGQYTRIDQLFKLIFRNADNLQMALDYLNTEASCNSMEDFKDGDLFKSYQPSTIPFCLYYDELETGNPLGSHKTIHKIGAIYLALRCFPTYIYSSLQNIHHCVLFPANMKKNLSVCLSKLVPELTSLIQKGVFLHGRLIKFQFIGFIGDNLGLHQVLGFTESFSANFHCRFCRANKSQTKCMTMENKHLLRNVQNYNADILTDNESMTGIKANSKLNKIPNYHVTQNSFVDVMHDVLEGVANFGMTCVINFYLKEGSFTLEELNNRLKFFPMHHLSNRPPPIKLYSLKKDVLPYSASEMMHLVLYFCLIIGDRLGDDDVYQYYLILREIVSILLMKKIPVPMIEILGSLISEHHSMYMSLFNKSLRPKHHFMIHYPHILRLTGPLCHNWSMRFESKHLETKIASLICRSRVNLCKSIAIRHSFILSYDCLIFHSIAFNSISSVGPSDGRPCCYEWIIFKGCKYRKNGIISYDETDVIPVFGRIQYVAVHDASASVVVLPFETVHYNPHLCSYHVTNTISRSIKVDIELVSPPLMSQYILNCLYVVNVNSW